MASVEKRARDGRTSYVARWRDGAGQQRKKSFARKGDADRFTAQVEADLSRGTYIAPDLGRVTFGIYAAEWVRIQHHRPATAELVERQLRLYVLPVLGARPLGAVRPSEVQGFVKGLSERLAPTTVTVAYSRVVAIFAAAVRDRRITSTPCVGITLPRRPRTKVEPLSTPAVRALVDAVPARYRALIVLAAGTGLRQGECFGLGQEHIDFLRRTVRVERQLVTNGGKQHLGPPKTEGSARTVPLPDVVLTELAAHFASYPPAGEWGLLFTSTTGTPIWRSSWRAIWAAAAQTAGLPAGATFHSLRHYYASLLIGHGESVKVVSDRLGHTNAAETLNTYAHLWPDSEDRTREAVDLVLGPGGGGACAPAVPSATTG